MTDYSGALALARVETRHLKACIAAAERSGSLLKKRTTRVRSDRSVKYLLYKFEMLFNIINKLSYCTCYSAKAPWKSRTEGSNKTMDSRVEFFSRERILVCWKSATCLWAEGAHLPQIFFNGLRCVEASKNDSALALSASAAYLAGVMGGSLPALLILQLRTLRL